MLTILLGACLLVAAAGVVVLWRLAAAVEQQTSRATIQQVLATFGGATAAVQQDPKQLLAWYPLAQCSRKLFPDAFIELDTASGGAFPFTKEQLQAAHARCSSDWLAWERAHDAEYSLKAAQVEEEISRAAGPVATLLRTRLAAVEQQKLERYQQRYEEYVKTAKALAAFLK